MYDSENNIISLKIVNGRYANLKSLYSISEKSIIIETPSQINVDTGVHEKKLVVIKKEDIKNIEYTSYKKDNSSRFALIFAISIWVLLTLYRLQTYYRFYNSDVVLFEVVFSGISAAFWGFVVFLFMKFFKKDYQVIRLVTSDNEIIDFKYHPIFKEYLGSDIKLGKTVFTKSDDINVRETSGDLKQKYSDLINNIKSGGDTLKDFPQNVKKIIELIASSRDSVVQKLKKDGITDELDVNDFSAMLSLGEIGSIKNRVSFDLIEKALLITGLFKGNPATVFEYEGWYINPAAIIMENEHMPYALSKIYVTPSTVFFKRRLACMLAESYGMNAYKLVGIDFTTEKWMNILSKEDGLIGVLMMFLRASVSYPRFEDYLFNFYISNPGPNLLKDYSNKSKMAVRFVIEELMYLCLEIAAFNGEIDFFNEIKIVSSEPFVENGLYWVEIGNFYAAYSKTKPSNVDIGPLKTLLRSKKESMTLAEYIKTIGLDSGIRFEKREKASPIDF